MVEEVLYEGMLEGEFVHGVLVKPRALRVAVVFHPASNVARLHGLELNALRLLRGPRVDALLMAVVVLAAGCMAEHGVHKVLQLLHRLWLRHGALEVAATVVGAGPVARRGG